MASLSYDARLDRLTDGRLVNLGVYIKRSGAFGFARELRIIQAQPRLERIGLLNALGNRFLRYGRQRGFLEERPETPPEQSIEAHAARFMIQDVLGIKPTITETVQDKLKDLFVEFLKTLVNAKGVLLITLAKDYLDFVTADSADDAARVIEKIALDLGKSAFIHWLRTGGSRLLMQAMQKTSLSSSVRNLVQRRVSLLIAQEGILAKFIERSNLIFVAATILLEGEDIATDQQEEKFAFMSLLVMVMHAERGEIASAVPPLWRLPRAITMPAR